MGLEGFSTTVLVDANVFYSKTLRDWLGLCYLNPPSPGWFEVLWTEDIMAEFMYHMRKRLPTAPERAIGGIRDQLAATFELGRVTGYTIDDTSSHPDIFDAHVHAAALHAGADIILTQDKAFDQTDDLQYEVHDADSFFCLLDDRSPATIVDVLNIQIKYWIQRNKPFNLCKRLEKAGASEFAERVRQHLQDCY